MGGIPSHTSTVVIGSTGTGKTTLGLHFLSECTPQEPGLMFSFFEAPHRLRQKARGFGLDFEAMEASGALTLKWHSQGEHVLDELAHRLLGEVAELGTRRLLIDGLSGFFESSVYPERTGRFFSCLTNELRRLGVTVMLTLETMDVVGSAIATPFGVSGFVDNLFFLRFVQSGGNVKRLLTIIKMRDSDFDPGLHQMTIGPSGISIAGIYSLDGDVIPSAQPMTGTSQ